MCTSFIEEMTYVDQTRTPTHAYTHTLVYKYAGSHTTRVAADGTGHTSSVLSTGRGSSVSVVFRAQYP